MLTSPKVAMKKAQKHVMIALVLSSLAVNSMVFLAGDPETQRYVGDLTRPIVASLATGLAILVVARQGFSGIFGKAFSAIAAGLVLFLAAEIIWAYYSIGLAVEVPFPSFADACWLAAYAPFGYGLFKLALLYKGQGGNNRPITLMAIIVAAFSSYYIAQLILVSDVTTADGAVGLAVGIAYPILDAILIVPCLVAVIASGRGYLTAVPWIFMAWIFTAVADSIYGFAAVTSMASLISIENIFYNTADLSMAAGMYWHNRYMIMGKKHHADANSVAA